MAGNAPEYPKKTLMVYIGKRMTGSGKVMQQWVVVDSIDQTHTEDSSAISFKTQIRGFNVGNIVEFTRPEEGTAVMKGKDGPRIAGHWQDRQQVLKWQAEEITVKNQQETEAMIKTQDRNEIETALSPIRDILFRHSYQRRLAIIAYVIDLLLK